MGFLIFLLIVWAIFETVQMFMEGTPPHDEDVLEAIDKAGVDQIKLSGYDNERLVFGDQYRGFCTPRIKKLKSLIFPYSIDGVGCIPFWYKSEKIITDSFKKLTKSGREKKRKGLNL